MTIHATYSLLYLKFLGTFLSIVGANRSTGVIADSRKFIGSIAAVKFY